MRMTPLDIKVKQYMRDFLNGELNRNANRRGTPVTEQERQESERFLDAMWVYMNTAVLNGESA